MKLPVFSPPQSVREAKELQDKLAAQVVLQPLSRKVELVCGCDLSFSRGSSVAFYALTVYSLSRHELVEVQVGEGVMEFPYVPGLLAFRELPVLLEGFRRLSHRPDVVVVDGHGTAHPRRMGIATHLGLVLGLPTVGCAKKILVGEYGELEDRPGASVPLLWKGEQIGYALRSRKRAKPIFVSPGHLCDFPSSLWLIQQCLRGYRLPEVTRLAHLYANEARRRGEQK